MTRWTGSAPGTTRPRMACPPSWYATRSLSASLRMMGRSGPSTIFSSASMKVLVMDLSCWRRAARSAASLTRFRMSAPETPGVVWRDFCKVDVVCERHLSGVDFEDRFAALLVRQVHDDAAIEPARAQERLIEHVGLVCRGQYDDPFAAREAIHFGQDLVQRLLLLAGAADRPPGRARGLWSRSHR